MEKFLKEVAQYACRSCSRNLEELTVVFPNRRAALFFQQYLSEWISQPVFCPKMLTIKDLVASFSTLEIVESNRLLIDLYQIYIEKTGSSETLDEFFFWGEMLLNDFNEIDKYLIDSQQLFKNIESLRELDMGFDFLSAEQIQYLSTFWDNVIRAKESDGKKGFLQVWKQLFPVYQGFYKHLVTNRQAYEGMVYRDMVEKLAVHQPAWEGKTLFFVGFNALNQCEKKLFKFMQIHAKSSFFWDYDQFYLDRANHEAGLFMRENLLQFPMPADFVIENRSFDSPREIEVISVSGNTGQSVYVSDWLVNNRSLLNNRFDNTAVVLCDEKLLNPVLQSLPEFIDEVNITMGFPFRSSGVYGLVKAFFDLEKNSRKGPDDKDVFYYRHVLGLLGHAMLGSSGHFNLDAISREITDKNKIYLNSDDFEQNPFLSRLFQLPADAKSCKNYLHMVIGELITTLPPEALIDKETLHLLYLTVNQLHDSLFSDGSDPKVLISKRLFYQLLIRQLEGLSIPFEGEPLKGLQLIGFLETRCLDFDHLIILSASDNNLPGSSHRNSFIPYNLRRGFGLPLAEHRQAMYAYYFYRILQRSKTVSLVFDNRSDGLSKGEVSRYINQIKYETDHLKINQKTATFGYEPVKENVLSIAKTGEVEAALKQYFENSTISPTAINTYIDCSLRFFFKYIEGIKEPDELAEKIDNLMFGRVAHVALELLYQPMLGKTIEKSWLNDLIDNDLMLNKVLSEALRREYFKGGNPQLNGSNFLAWKMIGKFLKQILKLDLEQAPFKLLGLEKSYISELELNGIQGACRVKIGGTIDRIDQIGSSIRVVDYKTGRAHEKLSSIENLFRGYNRNKAAFQTMLYAHCLYMNENPVEPLLPSVYGARAIFRDDFSPSFKLDGNDLVYQANRDEFISLLSELLLDMTDLQKPFEQTNEKRNCEFCPYNIICSR